MKRATSINVLPALIVLAGAAPLYAGPLNPPAGAVSSSMKTLAEVEPRTAINATNTPGDASNVFILSAPGSYYLTGSVSCPAGKTAIKVTTSGVHIDLNGFSVSGAAGSLSGITSGLWVVTDCRIINGSVNGFDAGVDMPNAQTVVSGVTARSNVTGLSVGRGSRVIDCVAAGNTGSGFVSAGRARFSGCVSTYNVDGYMGLLSFDAFDGCSASENSNDGFQTNNAVLTGCLSDSNSGDGFASTYACNYSKCHAGYNTRSGFLGTNSEMYDGCTSVQNHLLGISAGSLSAVRNCVVASNTQQGIKVVDRSTVTGNQVRFNGGVGFAGIWCSGDQNQVESNQSTSNGYGVFVGGTGNVVLKNVCGSNTTVNYSIVAGNRVGVITTGTINAAAISGNSGGGLGFTDPNANIAY
jgi:hypothetical protein